MNPYYQEHIFPYMDSYIHEDILDALIFDNNERNLKMCFNCSNQYLEKDDGIVFNCCKNCFMCHKCIEIIKKNREMNIHQNELDQEVYNVEINKLKIKKFYTKCNKEITF